ncbi:MAG: uracil-DNA glycosylase [Syntrophomonadaceae bacterium]|nr:uracil-DNA glycosylase [Syntrophomonadaceae bacterium]MDD3022614.1 uracil-DNA glycosylase [Syntrophomonadaceae bacterium]
MTTEQPNLFGEMEALKENHLPDKEAKEVIALTNFLPLVKVEEAYPEINEYEELWRAAQQCEKCRLRSTCRQVIFGTGNLHSKLILIGEGPGKDEDIQGQPFVGRAGQLLDKILQAAEIPRHEVYISNVVKCRPPENRLPNPDEVKICKNWLEAQIRIIKPQIIVCLGAMASQVVIDPKATISKIRGRWFSRQGIKIIATFHPAALLRNVSYKKPTWEDFKLIRDAYNEAKRCPPLL